MCGISTTIAATCGATIVIAGGIGETCATTGDSFSEREKASHVRGGLLYCEYYWQPVKAMVGAFTVVPAVTVIGVDDLISDGLQLAVLPEPGTKASASSV